jgi:hypothetical protein
MAVPTNDKYSEASPWDVHAELDPADTNATGLVKIS